MPCEPLIDEGVVDVEQVDDTAILTQHAREQQLGLLAQRLAQIAIELPGFRRHGVEQGVAVALRREARNERISLRVGEHSL